MVTQRSRRFPRCGLYCHPNRCAVAACGGRRCPSQRTPCDRRPPSQQEPLLTLTDPIRNSYDPQTVTIYANVVAATQGETLEEILGNGDSTLTHQTFSLQKPPLTYVAATTPSGAATTLQVRVNQVLWREVPSLYQRSPQDQVYITRIADDRSVTITLGDGVSGARLPTGLENVSATYRSGIGLAGLVAADRLSLLKTRPLGIAQVTNPLPATGAADPETMAEARTSAPLTVRTLDRIVSLQDYEDFARAFAGIGKAQAELLRAGETQLVHITVAAIGGRPVLADTPLYSHLIGAIDGARDPVQQVRVSSYESIAFNLEAKLLVDPRYLSDRVMAQAKAALLQRFVFDQRQFGQGVTASEAIATLQAVEGMIAVDLDALHRRDRTRRLEQSVTALTARWQPTTGDILPAQLLVINPAGIRLRVEATL
ncbi:MAG: putative baseplate assembly protein [Leptolyngbyaceae cyanobacterium SL_7_1]|nr:putative baseplate assembly protein [Leptolyngbyaceae cyanobacterium SL_7_1]